MCLSAPSLRAECAKTLRPDLSSLTRVRHSRDGSRGSPELALIGPRPLEYNSLLQAGNVIDVFYEA